MRPAPIFEHVEQRTEAADVLHVRHDDVAPAALRDLREPLPPPEELAARDAQARAAAQLVVRRADGERLLDPVELRGARAAGTIAKKSSRLKALVEVDAQRELGELLAQPRERREAGGGFLDGALGVVDGLERRALERLESLRSQLADDRGVFLGAARSQRAVDRRVERQAFERSSRCGTAATPAPARASRAGRRALGSSPENAVAVTKSGASAAISRSLRARLSSDGAKPR